MTIYFATCNRKSALEFIGKIYPNKKICSNEPAVKDFLDAIEKDLIRVQEPSTHCSQIKILSGSNFMEKYRKEIEEICTNTQQYLNTL